DDPLARLSAREREVLQLLAEGRTGAEIAQRLSLSQKTVETYRARLVEKLGIRDVAGLVRVAIQRGLPSREQQRAGRSPTGVVLHARRRGFARAPPLPRSAWPWRQSGPPPS